VTPTGRIGVTPEEHGHSTERDFIYVTTQRLTHHQLSAISEEVGPERRLLICCIAYKHPPDQWPNLTLKKIPKAVMERCEWGRDDYSLAISNLPPADPGDPDTDAPPPRNGKKSARAKKATVAGQADLFASEGDPA
jgi:adenine-specific DNA-methyltransferase